MAAKAIEWVVLISKKKFGVKKPGGNLGLTSKIQDFSEMAKGNQKDLFTYDKSKSLFPCITRKTTTSLVEIN